MAELNWSDAQWQKVNDSVTEAFGKASVASAFLQCYGPLPGSAENVREEKFTATGATVTVSDDKTLKLFNLRVKVELSSEQVADESLSSALLAFRRAANTLAQVEDDIVFNGYEESTSTTKPRTAARAIVASLPTPISPNVVVSAPDSLIGLVHDAAGGGTAQQIKASSNTLQATKAKKAAASTPGAAAPTEGEHVVKEVAAAVVNLERNSHPGPFACVLGSKVFEAVYTPTANLVLPADRIPPILNGPLLRSGLMAPDHGIVVSLAGSDIDVVVATPPKVQFLQVDSNARYIFRVYEKFILRIKDPTAVRGFGI